MSYYLLHPRGTNIRHIALLSLLLFVGCEDPPVSPPSEIGFAWKATYNDNTAYFLGTVHVGPENFSPLSKKIDNLLSSSDVVYVELTPQDIKRAGQKILESTRNEPDDGLANLPADLTDELKGVIGDEGYNSLQNKGIEIWGVTLAIAPQVALSGKTSTGLPLKTEYGIDALVIKEAINKNKLLFSLDKVIDQVEAISFEDGYEVAKQIELLRKEINPLNIKEEITKSGLLVDGYREGNSDFFDKEVVAAKKEYSLEIINGKSKWDVLVVNRNNAWAEKIANLLKNSTGKTYFIAGGTLHWFGEDSVLKKLKAKLPEIAVEKIIPVPHK